MLPPKKAKNDSDAAETVSWTDDEVELLLGVVRSYSSQNDYKGLGLGLLRSRVLLGGELCDNTKNSCVGD